MVIVKDLIREKVERKTLINGTLYIIESGGEIKEEGNKRVLVKDSEKKNKKATRITQVFHNGKWINNSEYLRDKELVLDLDVAIQNKKVAAKEAINEYNTFFNPNSDSKIKRGFIEDELDNILSRKEFSKTQEELNKLSPTEFQDYCIRMLIDYDLSKIEEKKIGKGELRRKIDSYISRYLENNPNVRNGLNEGQYQKSLEAGIYAAYEYAAYFLKNKKPNEDLCTNDIFDKKIKTDYIKIVQDENGLPDKVYLIQIKSNIEIAEKQAGEIFISQQKYLNSFEGKTEEVFKKKREEFVSEYMNAIVQKFGSFEGLTEDKISEFKKEKRMTTNILYAKEFISLVTHVNLDQNNELLGIKDIKKEDLTFPYK